MNIEQVRQDTPGVAHVTHFNNAGSALCTQNTLTAIQSYLEKEAITGGYLMTELEQNALEQIYVAAAQLINAQASEIAVTENATVSFVKALFSIPFQKGDIILTSEIEYGTNYLNFLHLKESTGIEIQIVPSDEYGHIDLHQLEAMINPKVKLIAVTHIPTNSGMVADVITIGKIAKAHDILYLVDACQSIGQLPFDVKEVQCDFCSATSRKYLRGPRGLGFLYVKKGVLEQLTPPYYDMLATTWKSKDDLELNHIAKMYENFERPMALIVGFAEAIDYQNRLGIHNTWERIQELAAYLRKGLQHIKGVTVQDIGQKQCGIVTFTKSNHTPADIKATLLKEKVNTSVSYPFSSLLDMERRGLDAVVRASVHYYNTHEEIDHLLALVEDLR
ncbi:MAG: aminotransferase class V-fold PLP-dependent enzyme [Chitinophagales bacterium]